MTLIQSLVDESDAFEQIRDEIAAILAAETASQQALAITAGKDPDAWAFSVYTERANPWESLRQSPGALVNVWFDISNINTAAGGTTSRQSRISTFNVDIYTSAASKSDGGGHIAGDEQSAKDAQRIARLVRNFLKADVHKYLGMRGVVSDVNITTVEAFQPQQEAPNAIQVAAVRERVEVKHNELHPEYEAETMELLQLQVARGDDGQVIFDVQYQST